MKTLYIHGLDSFPRPGKVEILRGAGLSPVALHLDYRQKLGVYETLKDSALHKDVQFIIGSSFGGFLGFLLAEDLGLPCLLFNPAMEVLEQKEYFYNKVPELASHTCPNRYVVLGAKDDVIDPVKNLDFFKKQEREGLSQKVVTCEWLGHSIDFDTFSEMVHWAVHSLNRL